MAFDLRTGAEEEVGTRRVLVEAVEAGGRDKGLGISFDFLMMREGQGSVVREL
jgi:hypothetical protein